MRWWPWGARQTQPSADANEVLRRAEGELRKAYDQNARTEEVTRRAHDVIGRAGRFTRDVDRALRLRGV